MCFAEQKCFSTGCAKNVYWSDNKWMESGIKEYIGAGLQWIKDINLNKLMNHERIHFDSPKYNVQNR